MPTQIRLMRKKPLPEDVVSLLQIVAGDEAAIEQAIAVSGQDRRAIYEASAFFIEQLMFYPEADSYRVLGARPNASSSELRRNMALLLRWLHPDVEEQTGRSVFAQRITKAWNELKTTERRAAYDRSLPLQQSKQGRVLKKGGSRAETSSHPRNRHPNRAPVTRLRKPSPRRMGFWDRVVLLIFGRFVR